MKLTIDLNLYASLRHFAPPNASSYPVEAGTTIETMIEALNIPKKQILLIFSNGVKCSLQTLLKDGDRIGIFPPVGGG
jgi:molybdopterin converting factor small subunit